MWNGIGAFALVPGVVLVGGAVALFVLSDRRYGQIHRNLTGDRPHLPDGVLPLMATSMSLVLGAVALWFVVITA